MEGIYSTQPSPQNVDLNGDASGSTAVTPPTCQLDQTFLEQIATQLNEEGAFAGDTDAWITPGPEGPIYPLLIGQGISHTIALSNPEYRRDYRSAYEGFGDANPLLKRIGAARVIGNFRHLVTMTPPRWAYVAAGHTVTLAPASGTIPDVTYTNSTGSARFVRVPTYMSSTDSSKVTKGQASATNPNWRDYTIASYEGSLIMNPIVMTEEILRPTNAINNMKWQSQNYMGEWQFVNGLDAVVGFADCPNVQQDPTHKYRTPCRRISACESARHSGLRWVGVVEERQRSVQACVYS